MVDKDIQDNFDEFWQEIVCPNGEWNYDQIKKELFDFYNIIGQVSLVYDAITHGRISKPGTPADAVINCADEMRQREIQWMSEIDVPEDFIKAVKGLRVDEKMGTLIPIAKMYGRDGDLKHGTNT